MLNSYEIKALKDSILSNRKRMGKISRMTSVRDRRDQVRKYLVAEMQIQRVEATDDEIIGIVIDIVS